MRWNLSQIMRGAWKIFRMCGVSFSEALRRAWQGAKANQERIREAKEAAGITEEVRTWSGWKAAGREVQHGSKAIFQVILISSKGDYKASFFGISQTA